MRIATDDLTDIPQLIQQINHHTQSQSSSDKPILPMAWKKLKRILYTIIEHTDGTLLELDKDLRAGASEQQHNDEAKEDNEPEPDYS